jgi:hypothetical protein
MADDAFDELDLDSMNIVESGSRAINVADPFQKRAGKTLLWKSVNMTLHSKTGDRKLLEDVWGEVPAGETTAIMGAFLLVICLHPCILEMSTMALTPFLLRITNDNEQVPPVPVRFLYSLRTLCSMYGTSVN